MESTQLERREVLYRGNVQGVGFRYMARQIAQAFAVTGFVRNLDGGDVQLVVEGPAPELDRLLAEVAQKMGSYIRKADSSKLPATGQYQSFDIAY